MACRIGINGFGRIGRMVLRRTMALPDVEVVAVNDLANVGDLAYLLKYDSVHGLFPGGGARRDIDQPGGQDRPVHVRRDPARIPWARPALIWSSRSTGALRGRSDASGHLRDGVRKILISAPSDDVDVTLVPVNTRQYVRWWASSGNLDGVVYRNSLAPVAKVLQEHFGIA
jgi:glyceraldehyde 3-phosphate dehydrogenase